MRKSATDSWIIPLAIGVFLLIAMIVAAGCESTHKRPVVAPAVASGQEGGAAGGRAEARIERIQESAVEIVRTASTRPSTPVVNVEPLATEIVVTAGRVQADVVEFQRQISSLVELNRDEAKRHAEQLETVRARYAESLAEANERVKSIESKWYVVTGKMIDRLLWWIVALALVGAILRNIGAFVPGPFGHALAMAGHVVFAIGTGGLSLPIMIGEWIWQARAKK